MDDRASDVAITSGVVEQLGPGLDSGLQQRVDLSSASYGSVNASSGPDRGSVIDSTISSRQARNANGVPSKYIGVSVGRFWLVFGGILAAYFVSPAVLMKYPSELPALIDLKIAFFDSTSMASSHLLITSYFHSSNSGSWLSTVFLLTYTAFQSIFERISDTIGRRPLYLFALIIFVLTTVWCALAQSIGSFIAARALCGLGAGGAMSLGMIITSDLVHIEH